MSAGAKRTDSLAFVPVAGALSVIDVSVGEIAVTVVPLGMSSPLF